MKRVFITGMGTISSLGTSVLENHFSLVNGKSGIGKAIHFKSNYTDTIPFAEIKLSDIELQEKLKISRLNINRTSLISIHACAEAIQDAGLTQTELSSFSTALISSSTVGGMCNTDALYSDSTAENNPTPFSRSYENSDHTLELIKHFKIKGYTDTINTACSSSANAILLGTRLIQSGKAERVIVGGADCLAKFTVNGFNSLRILSELPCRPFDKERDGLTLGEAGAYLVLESQEHARNKKKYAEVIGYGNSNDAFHPSATSDEATGPRLAMEEALKNAELDPSQIDYINAHGTGTPNNDLTESFAFSKVFKTAPPFNSTKSYTGHTLAAAGSLGAIFSILSLNNNELYKSLSIANPLPEFSFQALTNYQYNVEINIVMANSFGFGGNCTSLIFRRCI